MKQAIMLCLLLAACGGAADDGSLEATYKAPADAGAPVPSAPDAAPLEEERQCQTITYDPKTGYGSSWGPCSDVFGD